MITEQEMLKLKRGDKVLVECTVESVFTKGGMVMVTTRDCDEGFDAYEDEVVAVVRDAHEGEAVAVIRDKHKEEGGSEE